VIFSTEVWDKTGEEEITVETKKMHSFGNVPQMGKLNQQKRVHWIKTMRGMEEEENQQ
jgi:hypothetical protein